MKRATISKAITTSRLPINLTEPIIERLLAAHSNWNYPIQVTAS